jgi:hypothetical protein
LDVKDDVKKSVLRPLKFGRVNAIDRSLLAFTMLLRAESQMPESELLFGDVAQVFLESRVQSERQRELASCHGNA